MPFPNTASQFKPGQSGNPGGHSQGRRITSALVNFIEEKGLDRDAALVIVAMATGQKHLLKQKVRDPETGREVWVQRTPELGWMNTLLERTEGKVPEAKNDGDERRGKKVDDFLSAPESPDEASEGGAAGG